MPEKAPSPNPLAIIGDKDIVWGFKALGFSVFAVKKPEEFSASLKEVLGQKPAICLVQDNIYQPAKELLKSYQSLALPIFIPFNKSGKADLLDEMVKALRLRATGAF